MNLHAPVDLHENPSHPPFMLCPVNVASATLSRALRLMFLFSRGVYSTFSRTLNTSQAYWRIAGMSYLKYANLCAEVVRGSLKEPHLTKVSARTSPPPFCTIRDTAIHRGGVCVYK